MSDWDNLDPDGCEDADQHFAYTALDGLGICGCGSSAELRAEVLKVLRSKERLITPAWQPGDQFGELGAELLLHVMDNAGLIEHGTSIRASWITEKGKRLLAVADRIDLDADDVAGFMCSKCPPRTR